MAEVSREEFTALADQVQRLEERQDAHAVVVAAAFHRLEVRLDRVDDHLGAIESRLVRMDDRFDLVDQGLDGLDHRFDGLDQRLDGLGELVPLVRAIARRLDVPE